MDSSPANPAGLKTMSNDNMNYYEILVLRFHISWGLFNLPRRKLII